MSDEAMVAAANKAIAKNMRATEILKLARDTFNQYAAMDPKQALAAFERKELTATQLIQAQLAGWEGRNFGAQDPLNNSAGAAEEMGELSDALFSYMVGMRGVGRLNHIALKRQQNIRGMADKAAAGLAVVDALGDVNIFTMNFCTKFRLDFWTVFEETAKDVMARDWNTKRNAKPGEE